MQFSSRKLLTIGHSYIVPLNRRLANEMARISGSDWDITIVSPLALKGDLRPLQLRQDQDDRCVLEGVSMRWQQPTHLMMYHDRLREILQQKWDLVHCWQEPYVVSGGQVARWTQPKTPLVYFTCQNNPKSYPPPFNWIETYSMQRATAWIYAGQTVANTLKQRRHYDLPTRHIPHGVDVELFAPDLAARQKVRQQLEWDTGDVPVIGFLGRFVPEKGLELMMRSLDQISQPWRALFVGTGGMEADLRSWGARYGDRVRVCTTVRHDQVPHYLNAMDLLCAPSQTTKSWREQFGRMLIEAFATGIPVIGSDSGEIPYVIGDAGIVVKEKDQTAWVQAISMLLNDPDQRNAFSKKGLDRAHSTYSWSVVARQHLEFFDSILERSNSLMSLY